MPTFFPAEGAWDGKKKRRRREHNITHPPHAFVPLSHYTAQLLLRSITIYRHCPGLSIESLFRNHTHTHTHNPWAQSPDQLVLFIKLVLPLLFFFVSSVDALFFVSHHPFSLSLSLSLVVVSTLCHYVNHGSCCLLYQCCFHLLCEEPKGEKRERERENQHCVGCWRGTRCGGCSTCCIALFHAVVVRSSMMDSSSLIEGSIFISSRVPTPAQ